LKIIIATMADDTDALFAALEQEADAAHFRAQRLQQLQAELSSSSLLPASSSSHSRPEEAITTLINNSSTAVPTLPTDQSVLDFTTQSVLAVVHFFHPDFSRCATMDKHLSSLAAAHAASSSALSSSSSPSGGGGSDAARFARADVQGTPFIVEKLKIRVLPCVLAFRDGVVVERIVGFQGLGLGGGDAEGEFETRVLEDRLVRCGVLASRKMGRGGDGNDEADEDGEAEEDEEGGWPRRRGLRSGAGPGRWKGTGAKGKEEDEDDDDWD
jgi:thiol-disulfide isomerase/thioredoxin